MLSSRSLTLVVGPALLGVALVGMAGCDRQSPDGAQPAATASAPVTTAAGAIDRSHVDRSHRGEPLPAITVRDPAGTTLDLAKAKGPLLINLWATWCAPCVAELPTLDALASRRTIRVVTVSQDMQTARVPQFLKDKGGPHLPVWLDPQANLAFKYGGATLPTTILYDAAGKEVWRYGGGLNWTGPQAAKLIAEVG